MKPKILISSERDDPCAKYTAAILAAGGLCCAENCICDLVDLKGSHAPVPLDDLLNHKEKSLSHTKTA